MKGKKKKSIIIEAIQFFDETDVILAIQKFTGVDPLRVNYEDAKNPFIRFETLEGDVKAFVGDYIIKGTDGEIYLCKSDSLKKLMLE